MLSSVSAIQAQLQLLLILSYYSASAAPHATAPAIRLLAPTAGHAVVNPVSAHVRRCSSERPDIITEDEGASPSPGLRIFMICFAGVAVTHLNTSLFISRQAHKPFDVHMADKNLTPFFYIRYLTLPQSAPIITRLTLKFYVSKRYLPFCPRAI